VTTDQKVAYIQSFMKLVNGTQTYQDACAQSNFVRGILGAWFADQTISVDIFSQYSQDLDTVMEVKRRLTIKGEIV
jgi:hypothetical protein